MAKIEWIDQRLMNWARWRLGGQAGGLGYAAMRWGVPTSSSSRDRDAVIPTNAVEASETDSEVKFLPMELRETIEVYYLSTGTRSDMCRTLGCATATIDSRLTKAHRILADGLAERARLRDQQRAELQKATALAMAEKSERREAVMAVVDAMRGRSKT